MIRYPINLTVNKMNIRVHNKTKMVSISCFAAYTIIRCSTECSPENVLTSTSAQPLRYEGFIKALTVLFFKFVIGVELGFVVGNIILKRFLVVA